MALEQRKALKPVVGWREYVDLPEWGIRRVRAKVDTGARTSALHVENIRELLSGKISFDVMLSRKNKNRKVRITARALKKGNVKVGHGVKSERWYVRTKIKMGPYEFDSVFNLMNREDMIHRILLGRNALTGRFYVDVSRMCLLGK